MPARRLAAIDALSFTRRVLQQLFIDEAVIQNDLSLPDPLHCLYRNQLRVSRSRSDDTDHPQCPHGLHLLSLFLI